MNYDNGLYSGIAGEMLDKKKKIYFKTNLKIILNNQNQSPNFYIY